MKCPKAGEPSAVYEQAKQCNLAEYTPERAARDAMTMQTDNNQLRKRALAEGPSFENFVKLGIAMESATAQAGKMERTESVSVIQHKERERMYAGKGPGSPQLSCVIFVDTIQKLHIVKANVQQRERNVINVRKGTTLHMLKLAHSEYMQSQDQKRKILRAKVKKVKWAECR